MIQLIKGHMKGILINWQIEECTFIKWCFGIRKTFILMKFCWILILCNILQKLYFLNYYANCLISSLNVPHFLLTWDFLELIIIHLYQGFIQEPLSMHVNNFSVLLTLFHLRIECILLKFYWGIKALTEVHFQWNAMK